MLKTYVLFFCIFCIILCGSFLDVAAGRTAIPIVIHRRIVTLPCELVQRGSLIAEKQFAWLEIEGVNGAVYSPELGPEDYLTPAPTFSGSAAKAARASGFELKTLPTTNSNIPVVESLNSEVKCPELAAAIADVEQQRTSKREQLQSKVYSNDSKGIIPAYASKSEMPPVQIKTSAGGLASKPPYQGTVVLTVVIGTDGSPRQVRVSRSLSPRLDDAATDLVHRWTFNPARMKGLPVPMEMPIEVTFREQ